MGKNNKWELPNYTRPVPKLIIESVHQLNADGTETDITKQSIDAEGNIRFMETDWRTDLSFIRSHEKKLPENAKTLKLIEDYCAEAGITPQELVDFHKKEIPHVDGYAGTFHSNPSEQKTEQEKYFILALSQAKVRVPL